ncbi:MAG: M20/M25/M40 family metallo-hydrolase [Campylobacterota bacterium]|nr:M20/M25/M40 family metallo-hydrolase [Campylobacterota bacterium]
MKRVSSIIEHFETITTIPHCSRAADKLFSYLTEFAKDRGYDVEVDATKNILIRRGAPKLCLQAHYDMVCMGDAPQIKTYEEDGWLKAKNSSLGADNGVAVAMMMQLMDEGAVLEFLVTADEEIGLIGANALSFDLQSSMMLNLDSEDKAEVYIGCAGGVDIVATKPYALLKDSRPAYRVTVSGLPGGHSGVDIDKDIPNALKLLAGYLKSREVGIVSLEGGERRNSIPVEASAIVKSDTPPKSQDHIQIEAVECSDPILYAGDEIIDLMRGFSHGVQEMSEAFKIPERSINLAIVSTQGALCKIQTNARAMSADGLTRISGETLYFFESYGFDVEMADKYPSWRPEVNEFTKEVSLCMEEVFGESRMMAMHAGLECGLLSEKYPAIKIASIGPTIRYPHSTREEVDIDSIDKTFEVLKRVVERVG